MNKVTVITGGGSGMGLEAAKNMPLDRIIVISGRTEKKLVKAQEEIQKDGHVCYYKTCDTSIRESVRSLALYALSLGEIVSVINAAGVSPTMAEAEKLLKINALGTVYINEEFSKVMGKGSVILDVSSSSAYVLPSFFIGKKTIKLAENNEKKFLKKMLRLSSLPHSEYKKRGFAYALSKLFVVNYAKKCAFDYGKKGIRVVSVSPGLVGTNMGKLEEKEGADLIKESCEKRMGRPEELGYVLATASDPRNGYLAGVDILVDGGSNTGKKYHFA